MISRRGFLCALPFALAGCRSDGNFTILGYSTKPPFDAGIRTVHVPVFKSQMVETTPYRDMEVNLTSAVVKEINTRTSWKVSSDREKADTELLGVIVHVDKTIMNLTPQNFARELQYVLTCTVVWRYLRTGQVLSNRRPQAKPKDVPVQPFDPSLPPPPPECEREKAVPVTIVATARVIPELGESTATGMKAAYDQMARQIVNMMEQPW
jgi:hypothetical protein